MPDQHRIKRLEAQVRWLAAALAATRTGGSSFAVDEGLRAIRDGHVPEPPPKHSEAS